MSKWNFSLYTHSYHLFSIQPAFLSTNLRKKSPMPGMPLAKGVGGLRWREFFFEGRVTQPERKAKIAQPDDSFLFFVFTIWLEWVILTVVFWDFYVPVALAIHSHSRMPVWNCSIIILSKWYLHVVARGNWSHSHSLRNNSQTYSSHESIFHGIPLRLTISWRWFQNYNYQMHPKMYITK